MKLEWVSCMLCLLPISPTLVQMNVSARDLTRITLGNNHTAYIHICRGWVVCVQNYPPEIVMQPSSSTRATIVSAENQNGATVVKATFLFCHYYIVWGSNNAGEARGQSWNTSLKPRWIPGGSCGYTSGTKRKHFAAFSSPRPWWRWLQLQPSCGFPQWLGFLLTIQNPNGELNTLRPRQNGRHFPDDTFKRIFMNENVRISIKISLKFVPKGPINKIPALDQIMAWRRPGDKPLSEPMMINLPTHICVSRPQWVNEPSFSPWDL